MEAESHLRAAVDRFERDEKGKRLAVLVLDDGQQLVLAAEFLPPGVQVHQVVLLSFQLDLEETARRSAEIQQAQRDLFG